MRTGDLVKVGFAVVALVGAAIAFVVFNPFGGAVTLPKRVVLVDVETGSLYQVDTSKQAILPPLRSPDTEKLALLPVNMDTATERWAISQRYLTLVDSLEVEPNAIESFQTGYVTTTDASPRTIKPQY